MLKHIVLFKAKPGVTKSEFDSVIARFGHLPEQISEIASWWFRLPENPGAGYEAGFISEFESESDLAKYQIHPAHQELAQAASAVATAAVFDAWD